MSNLTKSIFTAWRLIAQTSRNPASAVSQATAPSNVSGEVTTAVGVNIPKIRLPSFNGPFGEWLKFRDTFRSLIHENTTSTNTQKFHYLQAALIGDAARVTEALGFSEVDYASAWSKLQERYEDSNALIHYRVQGLFELPAFARDSHSELSQLIDTASNRLLYL